MTEAEAIARLKDHFKIHDDGRPTPKLDEAVGMAINALEKQIAKKVKELNEEKNLYVASCTVCGYLVYRNQRYCDGCGQKLDWSEV